MENEITNPDDIPIKPAQLIQEGDRPLTGGGGFDPSKFSEYPDPSAQKVESKPLGALSQRVNSKTPKVRAEAFQQLIVLLSEGQVAQHYNYDSFLKDTNPQCMQKAYILYEIFLKKGNQPSENAVNSIFQFGMGTGKGATKAKSQEMLINAYQKKTQSFQAMILKFMQHKTPKFVAQSIFLLTQLLKQYGPKKMGMLKSYFPTIEKVMGSSNAGAKTQAMSFYKEVIKFMGKEFADNIVKNLKEAVIKQLNAFYQTWDKVVPTAPRGQAEKPGKKMDAYDFSQAADIFKKFNEKWVEEVLKQPNWKLKAQKLTQLIQAASVPKLSNGDLKPMNQLVKRLIGDSNAVVVCKIIKIVGLLSKGLRKHYSGSAKMFFAQVLSKFREKKTQLIEQTKLCLDDMLYSINLEDVQQILKAVSSQKNVPYKSNFPVFIEKAVAKKYSEKNQLPDKTRQCLINLIPVFASLLGDGNVQVRDSIASSLAKMRRMLGGEYMQMLQGKLGKKQSAKLRQLIQKQKKDDPPQQPAPPKKEQIQVKSPPPPPPQKKEIKEVRAKPSLPKIQMEQSQPTPLARKPPAVQKQKARVVEQSKSPPPKQEQSSIDLQGADRNLFDVYEVPQQTLKKIESSNHEERLMGYRSFFNQSKAIQQGFTDMLRFMKKVTKDWSQNNLNINKEILSFLDRNKDSRIGTNQSKLVAVFLLTRFSQSKFQDQVISILTESFRRSLPKHFINYLLKKSKDKKTPKFSTDLCSLLARIIDVVSARNVPVKDILGFGQDCYGVTHSKKGAQILLKKLYEHMGQDLKLFIDPAIVKNMDPELKKVQVLNVQTKFAFDPSIQAQAQAEANKQSLKAMLQGMPRVDISADIAKFSAKINDPDWKQRKDSCQNIQKSIVAAKNRINAAGTGELINNLRNKLGTQSNKNTLKAIVNLMAKLIQAIPSKQSKNHSKLLIPALLNIIGDKSVRTQVLVALSKLSKSAGNQQIISSMIMTLDATDNIQVKTELMNFLLKVFDQSQPNRSDQLVLAKVMLNSLNDKAKEIRDPAELLLAKLFPLIGIDSIENITKDFKAANKAQVKAVLQKLGCIGVQAEAAPSRKLQRNKTMVSLEQSKEGSRSELRNKSPAVSSVRDNSKSKKEVEVSNPKRYIKTFSAIQEVPKAVDKVFAKQIKFILGELVSEDIYDGLTSFYIQQAVSFIDKVPSSVLHANAVTWLSFYWIRMTGVYNSSLGVKCLGQCIKIIQQIKYASDQFFSLFMNIIRQAALIGSEKVNQILVGFTKDLMKQFVSDRILKQLLEDFSNKINPQSQSKLQNCYLKIIKSALVEGISSTQSLQLAGSVRFLRQDSVFVEMLYEKFSDKLMTQCGFSKAQTISASHVQQSNNQHAPSPAMRNSAIPGSQTYGPGQLQAELSKIQRPSGSQKIAVIPPSSSPLPKKVQGSKSPLQQMQRRPVLEQKLDKSKNDSKQPLPFEKNPYEPPEKDSYYGITLYYYPPNFPMLQKYLSSIMAIFDKKISQAELHKYSPFIMQQLLLGLNYCQNYLRNMANIQNFHLFLKCMLFTIKCPTFVKSSGEVASSMIEAVFRQLLYQDRSKAETAQIVNGLDIKPQQFLKMVNDTMVKMIDNTDSNDLMLTLLDLIYKFKDQENQKAVQVINRSIMKACSQYNKNIQNVSINAMLQKMHKYCVRFYSGTQDVPPCFKSLLKETAVVLGEQFWRFYRQSIVAEKDNFIGTFVNQMGICQPQQVDDQDDQQEQFLHLEELDQIIKCILNERSTSAIQQLKRFRELHESLNLRDCLGELGYNQRMIKSIMAYLNER